MRAIPDPGFPGDDGTASAAVTEALSAYDLDPDRRHAATLALLQTARLLVPVVAVLGDVEQDEQDEQDEHGLAREKSSDMATVLLRGRDGRMALLAFTSMGALARWDPAGRPVPVSVRDAARAAVQDGAAALVVDVAGPVRFVVEEHDLRALADGLVLTELVGVGAAGRYAWVRPQAS